MSDKTGKKKELIIYHFHSPIKMKINLKMLVSNRNSFMIPVSVSVRHKTGTFYKKFIFNQSNLTGYYNRLFRHT